SDQRLVPRTPIEYLAGTPFRTLLSPFPFRQRSITPVLGPGSALPPFDSRRRRSEPPIAQLAPGATTSAFSNAERMRPRLGSRHSTLAAGTVRCGHTIEDSGNESPYCDALSFLAPTPG